MNRDELVRRLLELPAVIGREEVEYISAQQDLRWAREHLANAEAALLLKPEEIDGKNAEQRTAQLRVRTMAERKRLLDAELEEDRYARRLHELQNELASLRAVARLLAADAA